MPQSLSVEIAQAWVDALNAVPGGTFSQGFTATREYLVITDLTDLEDTLVVSVRYGGRVGTPGTREVDDEVHEIQIGVQKKPATFSNAEFDTLSILVEEIFQWTKRKRVTLNSGGSIVWTESSTEFLEEYMRQMNQFAAVVGVKGRTYGD